MPSDYLCLNNRLGRGGYFAFIAKTYVLSLFALVGAIPVWSPVAGCRLNPSTAKAVPLPLDKGGNAESYDNVLKNP